MLPCLVPANSGSVYVTKPYYRQPQNCLILTMSASTSNDAEEFAADGHCHHQTLLVASNTAKQSIWTRRILLNDLVFGGYGSGHNACAHTLFLCVSWLRQRRMVKEDVNANVERSETAGVLDRTHQRYHPLTRLDRRTPPHMSTRVAISRRSLPSCLTTFTGFSAYQQLHDLGVGPKQIRKKSCQTSGSTDVVEHQTVT